MIPKSVITEAMVLLDRHQSWFIEKSLEENQLRAFAFSIKDKKETDLLSIEEFQVLMRILYNIYKVFGNIFQARQALFIVRLRALGNLSTAIHLVESCMHIVSSIGTTQPSLMEKIGRVGVVPALLFSAEERSSVELFTRKRLQAILNCSPQHLALFLIGIETFSILPGNLDLGHIWDVIFSVPEKAPIIWGILNLLMEKGEPEVQTQDRINQILKSLDKVDSIYDHLSKIANIKVEDFEDCVPAPKKVMATTALIAACRAVGLWSENSKPEAELVTSMFPVIEQNILKYIK